MVKVKAAVVVFEEDCACCVAGRSVCGGNYFAFVLRLWLAEVVVTKMNKCEWVLIENGKVEQFNLPWHGGIKQPA